MQEFFTKIIHNISSFYKELEPSKRVGAIALTAFIVAVFAGIIIWASSTQYNILYSDLNKDDSKRLSTLLEEKKIPYQLVDNGKTIKIPDEMVNRFRLEVAILGVNFSGPVGYEVFDKQSFGTSNFVQKINKQRALEGELVKTIKYLRGVQRARVHLSIPESSPFVSERKPPTASVVLELDRGVSLTSSEIKGIGSLVSSSVDGMRAENVVIVDNRGKKLSENIGDLITSQTANRMALESKLSRKYEKKIEDILGKVVGEGRVIAKVSVEMDFTESIATETRYDQDNAAILSEVKNSQKLNGSRPSPQGIPGARSNLPGEQPQPGVPETKNNVNKELTTRNYNVPSKVIKSKSPMSGVKKVSSAVMIDGKRVPSVTAEGAPALGKDGKQIMRYEKWSDADLENFSAIVVSALGLNQARGDQIVIKNMEFANTDFAAADIALREQYHRNLITNIAKYLAIGISISLFFFFVVRPFVQWVTDNTVESVEDFLPRTLEELEKMQANQKLPGLEDALPQLEDKLNPEKIEGNLLKEKIISLVESNPQKAAQILHEMIHSSESDKQIA